MAQTNLFIVPASNTTCILIECSAPPRLRVFNTNTLEALSTLGVGVKFTSSLFRKVTGLTGETNSTSVRTSTKTFRLPCKARFGSGGITFAVAAVVEL